MPPCDSLGTRTGISKMPPELGHIGTFPARPEARRSRTSFGETDVITASRDSGEPLAIATIGGQQRRLGGHLLQIRCAPEIVRWLQCSQAV